jgi:hypothetical protein
VSREKSQPERAPDPTLAAAVDAGARGWFDARQLERRDDSRLNPATGDRWRWDDLNELDQKAYRAFVRPIVVAALASVQGGGA